MPRNKRLNRTILVVQVYRRKIKEYEVQAAEKVDGIFINPFDLVKRADRDKLNEKILRSLREIEEKAYKEGLKFGDHIREETLKAIEEKREREKEGKAVKFQVQVQDPGPGKVEKKAVFKSDMRDLFFLSLNRIENHLTDGMKIETIKMEQMGMRQEEIKKVLSEKWLLLEFAGFKNKVRRTCADFIAHSSDVGYYKGLGVIR